MGKEAGTHEGNPVTHETETQKIQQPEPKKQ